MNCNNCGYEAEGRFCSNCGARLSEAESRVSSAGTTMIGPALLPRGAREGEAPGDHDTPHFRLQFGPGSLAAENISLIGDRLEHAYAAIAELLGVDLKGAMIAVFLSELVIEHGGQRLGGGGYAVPRRMQIHDVYTVESPGESLERSLLVLLLALVLGDDREVPPLLLDGLYAGIMRRLYPSPADEQTAGTLAEAKTRGELPAPSTLLAGPGSDSQAVYFPVAAGFVDYLLQTYGVQRFKTFLRGFDVNRPDAAARQAYGHTMAQLDKAWNKSIKLGSPGGTMRFLRLSLTYLRDYKLGVAEIVAYIGMAVAFTIGLAKMQQFLFDRALGHRDLHALAVIMGILVASFIVVSITSWRQSYLTAHVSGSILKDMRLRMFSLIQRLDPGFFQTTRTGDIMSRMTNDMAIVQNALTGSMAQGFRLLLTLVAAVITIFLTDWKLALLGVAPTPLLFLASIFFGPRAARASRESQRQLAAATSTLQENLGAQPVVKAFGLEDRTIRDFGSALTEVFRSSLRVSFLSGMYGVSVSSLATAINLAVLGVGAYLVIQGDLTAGILVAFLSLIGQVIGPVQSLSSIMQGFQQATGSMDRIDEFLKVEPAIRDAPDARGIDPVRESVRLENVTFGYDEADAQIRDLSLSIPAGSSVAIVGPSGCGKSTTLNLIMRFYDPSEGRVTLDGVDIKDATLESVRGQMGVVFQDSVLFNLTIRENIRLGKLNASDEEVEDACRAAEIHDLIMSLPDEYDTVVGERGSRLSGGQRQRMAIARAILRDPAILILDEATSALDPRTEAAITETLARIGHGRTTISVTHRLSSVVNANRIFVLDRGRLVDEGTHDELLESGGLYAQLWQEQGGVAGGNGQADVAQLENVSLFAGLDPATLASLARRLTTERFAPEEEIIRAGEEGDKLYILQHGQVNVIGRDPLGRERPLAVLREGEHFGEMALLRDTPRMATCRARTSVQVLSLAKADFNGLLSAMPHLRQDIERAVELRLTANVQSTSAPVA